MAAGKKAAKRAPRKPKTVTVDVAFFEEERFVTAFREKTDLLLTPEDVQRIGADLGFER
jgi:hypothetical protein